MLAEAGFASTSLRMRRAIAGTPEYPLRDAADLRATKAAIKSTGVSIFYIEIVFLDRNLEVRDLKPMFDAGAALGTSRVVAAGADADKTVVIEKLAEVCDLAARYRMAVDVEFMPYLPVRTLDDTLEIIRRSGRGNAHVLLDALHFYRSGSSLNDLREIAPRQLGSFQLCDAPAVPPADLAFEARNTRLLPGEGGLDLDGLIDLLPPDLPIGVEIPLAITHPELTPLDRARMTMEATRRFLGTSRGGASHAERLS
jgi:sugar phosphate isomerase/epimerase